MTKKQSLTERYKSQARQSEILEWLEPHTHKIKGLDIRAYLLFKGKLFWLDLSLDQPFPHKDTAELAVKNRKIIDSTAGKNASFRIVKRGKYFLVYYRD